MLVDPENQPADRIYLSFSGIIEYALVNLSTNAYIFKAKNKIIIYKN
jgi:hypothetical protein